jgi:hypothetical protein
MVNGTLEESEITRMETLFVLGVVGLIWHGEELIAVGHFAACLRMLGVDPLPCVSTQGGASREIPTPTVHAIGHRWLYCE